MAAALLLSPLLAGCDRPQDARREHENPVRSTTRDVEFVPPPFKPLHLKHPLGTVTIERLPQRVAALDMNEVDFLDQLGIGIVGMPKEYVPHFLARYASAADVNDLGALVQPNLESVHAARPDLILAGPLQAGQYKELNEIAPTLYFDVNDVDGRPAHIAAIKEHLLMLGRIFGKDTLAQEKAAALDAMVAQAGRLIHDRPERAMVLLHNNGAFSSFGRQSRYGFVFDVLGVKPVDESLSTNLHGQPVSSEFIHRLDPDIVYVIDRGAVMERRPAVNADSLANPLLRQTRAWKSGRVVVVDAEAWYVTAASPSALSIMIEDVLKPYRPAQ